MHFLHEKQDSRSDSLVGVLAKFGAVKLLRGCSRLSPLAVDLASQLFLGSVEVLVDREVDLDVVGVLDEHAPYCTVKRGIHHTLLELAVFEVALPWALLLSQP